MAGPGTGKTYQLAKRLQFLVGEQEISPKAITVITYTHEAAKSMRNKIDEKGKDEYITLESQPDNILTMHSFGHRILEENAKLIGLKSGINIIESILLRKAVIRDAALLLDFTESDSIDAFNDKTTANKEISEISKSILGKYSEILKKSNTVDFDDQIEMACELLSNHSEVLDKYKKQTTHLLVDEYQDINEAQHTFIKLLSSGQEKGLFAVGDDDQSIYGFRGSTPKYIRDFYKQFSGARVLQLDVSRRCPENILECAISVVNKFDSSRTNKVDLKYLGESPGLVIVRSCPSDSREAELISKIIYAKRASGEAKTFFILVPSKNYTTAISGELRSHGIDHEVGTGSQDDPVKIALIAIKKWLGTSPSNLDVRLIIELLADAGFCDIPSSRVRTDSKKAERHECNLAIAKLWESVIASDARLDSELMKHKDKESKLSKLANAAYQIQEKYKQNDVSGFVTALGEKLGVWKKISDIYQTIEKEVLPSSAQDSDIRIITIQKSKGLEADCIFIVGLEKGNMPKDSAGSDEIAEQARLFFVAMTRGKQEVHIMHSRKRQGSASYLNKSHQLQRSPFIDVFPADKFEDKYVGAKSAKKPSPKARLK